MKYTKEDIEKLIADVEWELEGFERPTANNSKKMLEALKQTVKLFAIPVVKNLVCLHFDWCKIKNKDGSCRKNCKHKAIEQTCS